MSTPTVCLDPDEVSVGTPNGPGLYLAPPGTEAPTDTTEDWDDPWSCLGYLSEDGPTVGTSTDSEDLTPWQSAAPIKSIITNRSVTLQFVLWQLNAETLALYFDTDVPDPDDDGSLDMEVRTDQSGHTYAVGIDSRDGERVLRVSFLRASLSDAGDMAISRGAVVPLDITLSALETSGSLARVQLGPSADSNGNGMRSSRNGTGAPLSAPGAKPKGGAAGGKSRRSPGGLLVPGAAATDETP